MLMRIVVILGLVLGLFTTAHSQTDLSTGSVFGGTITIPALPSAPSLHSSDLFIVDQSGTTRNTTLSSVNAFVNNGTISVTDSAYGAVCNGVTDDTAAINGALASGYKHVTIPAGKTCYSATGVTMPANIELSGGSFAFTYPTLIPGNTSMIQCARNVAICLTVQTAPSAGGGYVHNLAISTNATAGSPPTSGSCIRVIGGYDVTLENVGVYQCYDGYYWDGSAGLQIAGFMSHTFSAAIVDAHIIQDTTPELRITLSRFGSNGNNNYHASAFIRETGGLASQVGILPNGLFVTNTQFDQGGGGAVDHFLEFVGCLFCNTGGRFNGQEWIFTNNHVENVTNLVFTDSSWVVLYGLQMGNNLFASSGEMLNINAATSIWNLKLSANDLAGAFHFNSSTANLSFGTIVGNIFANNSVILDSQNANSTLVFSGNIINQNLTVQGSWKSLIVTDNIAVNGTIGGTITQLDLVGNAFSGAYSNTATVTTGLQADGSTLGLRGASTLLTLDSTTAGFPELIMTDSASVDASNAYLIFQKDHAGADVVNNDLVGTIRFNAWVNGAYRIVSTVFSQVNGTVSDGNNKADVDLHFQASSFSLGTRDLFILHGNTGLTKFPAAAQWVANGTTAVSLGSTGPTAATTPAKWLKVEDNSGVASYIPVFQ